MAHAPLPLAPREALPARRRFAETMRRDAWWAQSLVTFLILAGFVVYATWAAFQGAYYESGPYLSPFYSPLLFGDSHHAVFGPRSEEHTSELQTRLHLVCRLLLEKKK